MSASFQETLYSILGVSFDSSPDELKSAFRKRAAAVHPDHNPSDPHAAQRFREVKCAYDVLADEGRRKLYDTFGSDSLQDGFEADAERARRAQIEILAREANKTGGIDLLGELVVGPGEAHQGSMRDVTLQRIAVCVSCRATGRVEIPCGHCHGAGILDTTSITACEVCAGQGQVQTLSQASCAGCHGHGVIQIGTLLYWCPTCGGAGMTIVPQIQVCWLCSGLGQSLSPQVVPCTHCASNGWFAVTCANCNGRAQTPSLRRLRVKVPPGVEAGQQLRLKAEGERGRSGVAGHLLLRIVVR